MPDPVSEASLQRVTSVPPIVLVEDDHGHALLVERVLAKVGLLNSVVAFHDGNAALGYLDEQTSKGRTKRDLPALILLDLHLPGKSGLELLAWVKEQPDFHETPVIMLSGSTESEDIDRAFQLGADSYLVKPVAFDALVDGVTSLSLPWAVFQRRSGRPQHG